MLYNMQINKNNYQAWFLDYAEGNLNDNQKKELILFLDLHPEYKNEFEQFELIKLDKTNNHILSGTIKNSLKKANVSINEDNIEEYIIKHIEGLLNTDENIYLKKYLDENTQKKKLVNLYTHTKLKAEHVEFKDKLFIRKHNNVTTDNAEYYIIADKEGLLEKTESDILKNIINTDKYLQKLDKLYTITYLNKNEIYTYNNKHALKKKETGVLYYIWRYGVAAAACIVLYLLAYKTENEINIYNTPSASAEKSANSILNKSSIGNAINNNLSDTIKNNYIVNTISSNKNNQTNNKITLQKKIQDTVNLILIKEPVITDDYVTETEKEQENNYLLLAKEENTDTAKKKYAKENEDIFLTPIQYTNKTIRKKIFSPDLENTESIKPNELFSALTDRIGKITNNNVTLQSKHSSTKKEFFLRIGKFEISRSKNK